MGCCQILTIDPDFNASASSSPQIPDKPIFCNPVSLSLSHQNDPSVPPAKLTPYFGKQFKFDEALRSSSDQRHVQIN